MEVNATMGAANARRVLLLMGLLITGCGEGGEGSLPETLPDSLSVAFTRLEAPVLVRRPTGAGVGGLEGALEWLLRGPTETEVASGIQSWFSERTASALRRVEVDTQGYAIIDFHDLRPLIPGASSSTGSRLLLLELNETVFLHPEVHSVEYRMEGSCELFWEWLQYGCRTITRDEPGGVP